MSDAVERYKARLQREKTARKEAERLLEEKSRDLFISNNELQKLAESLESKVVERTQELQKAKDEAVQHAKVKSDFLANMSHELRTPMNGVLGMLHLLQEASLEPRYSKIVKTASHSGQLLLTLINDILDFTKLEESKLEIEELEFDPIELVELAVEPFISQTIGKKIDLLTQIPPSIPSTILGDPTRIQQIITNLVSNAIKFTEEGHVLVQCFYEQNTIILRVVDSGIGMSEEQAAKVFSAFSQADESTTRKYGGTGLGLSICKNLVEIMKGSIEVESALGKGTTFTVEIPLRSISGPREFDKNDNKPHTKCVLAMPHFLERAILQECLIHWNVDIVALANNEAEISEILQAHNLNLLVLDDSLLDNIESLRAIKKQHPQLHIVCFTEIENFNLADKQLHCLNKPIKRSELFNALTPLNGFANVNIASSKSAKKIWYQGQKILLVEDNLVNQEVAKELLSSVNLDVSIANDGQEAIEMVTSDEYELVLMDIQMPVLDGISATKNIRALGGVYETMPIFAMTAHNLKGDAEKSIQAGMNKHITKPIVPKKLFKAISEYLEKGEFTINEKQNNASTTASHQAEPAIAINDKPEGIELDAALERVAGNTKILHKLLKLFKDQQSNFMEEFNQQLTGNDFETLIRLVHTLKGSAANCGAMTLSSLASTLESTLKQIDEANQQATKREPAAQKPVLDTLALIQDELQLVFKSIDLLCMPQETTDQEPPLQKTVDIFERNQALLLLTQIKDEIYSDLSVVCENIQSLEELAKDSEYKVHIEAMSYEFDQFNYEGILQYAENLLKVLSEES